MILDEPFDGLDFEFRRFILDLLPGLAKNEGTSIFVTSHNLAEVQQISDRVALLNHGRIIAIGDSASLCAQAAQHRSLVITLGQDYPVERIKQLAPDATYSREKRLLSLMLPTLSESQDELILRLLKSGVSVSSVVQHSPSLEDVYLKLTREK